MKQVALNTIPLRLCPTISTQSSPQPVFTPRFQGLAQSGIKDANTDGTCLTQLLNLLGSLFQRLLTYLVNSMPVLLSNKAKSTASATVPSRPDNSQSDDNKVPPETAVQTNTVNLQDVLRLKHAAIHELGHAILAKVLGFKVISITILPDFKKQNNGKVVVQNIQASLPAALAYKIAGYAAAQSKFFPQLKNLDADIREIAQNEAVLNCKGDINDIRQYLKINASRLKKSFPKAKLHLETIHLPQIVNKEDFAKMAQPIYQTLQYPLVNQALQVALSLLQRIPSHQFDRMVTELINIKQLTTSQEVDAFLCRHLGTYFNWPILRQNAKQQLQAIERQWSL